MYHQLFRQGTAFQHYIPKINQEYRVDTANHVLNENPVELWNLLRGRYFSVNVETGID